VVVAVPGSNRFRLLPGTLPPRLAYFSKTDTFELYRMPLVY
jgi:hypothetical protein